MSVNRFEMTPVMLCAPPDALMPSLAALDGVTVIADIRKNWATAAAFEDVQLVTGHRRAAAGGIFFRVGMPDDDTGQDAITRLIALRPTGFVLCGCGGVADIQRFDVMLRVAEAEHGVEPGSIAVFAEAGDHLAFFVPAVSLLDISQRLKAIIFDSERFIEATASEAVNTAASRAGAPFLFARAALVLAARQASIACYELLQDNNRDAARTMRDIALADGFSGVIARNAVQLAALGVH
jgi:citrate lyase subunit beta / citryl-CoA lyase